MLIRVTPGSRMMIWAVGVYAVWQGLGVATGGDQRWGSPSFAVLRAVPHPTVTWGVLLVCFGVAVLAASALRIWWLKACGLGGLALWSLLFAIGALRGAQLVPTLANTAGKTYALIAVVALILVWVDERRRAADTVVTRAA